MTDLVSERREMEEVKMSKVFICIVERVVSTNKESGFVVDGGREDPTLMQREYVPRSYDPRLSDSRAGSVCSTESLGEGMIHVSGGKSGISSCHSERHTIWNL